MPILAHRMQEAVHGGLSRTARSRLQRLIEERPTSSARVRKERSASQPVSKAHPQLGRRDPRGADYGRMATSTAARPSGSCHLLQGGSPERSGPDRPSLAHEFRRRHDDRQGGALRCLHPQVIGRGSRSELQFPARAARGLRSVRASARSTRAGRSSRRSTTMAVSLAATWTGPA